MACRIQRRQFTLIELLVAMAVFTILMLALIGFFNSAQKVWMETNKKTMTYENARVAMDLISRDLQTVFYENDKVYFWLRGDKANEDRDEVNFISAQAGKPNDYCGSRLCEIRYTLANTKKKNGGSLDTVDKPGVLDDQNTNISDYDGWLYRSCTGDMNDSNQRNDGSSTSKPNWNFSYGHVSSAADFNDIWGATTGQPIPTSEPFERVIPYVVDIKFYCYNKTGTEIDPKNRTEASDVLAYGTCLPYYVKVDLWLLDRDSWKKWKAVNPAQDDPTLDIVKNNVRKFTKMVFVGDRGQYDN